VPCHESRDGGTDDCVRGSGDSQLTCIEGVCARPCGVSELCGVGFVCSDALGKKRCLLKCDEPFGECSTGARCESLPAGGGAVCVAGSLGPSCEE
jgi:hypothetical protein